jgi:hypothetical protein
VWKRKRGGGAGSRQGARPAEAGGVGRAHAGVQTGKNRKGRETADRWVLVTVLAIKIKLNQFKTIQTNLNSNQTRLNFILSKLDLQKVENFELKYCFEGFDGRNNFLHRNLSRFEMDFKLKFRESNV